MQGTVLGPSGPKTMEAGAGARLRGEQLYSWSTSLKGGALRRQMWRHHLWSGVEHSPQFVRSRGALQYRSQHLTCTDSL